MPDTCPHASGCLQCAANLLAEHARLMRVPIPDPYFVVAMLRALGVMIGPPHPLTDVDEPAPLAAETLAQFRREWAADEAYGTRLLEKLLTVRWPPLLDALVASPMNPVQWRGIKPRDAALFVLRAARKLADDLETLLQVWPS